ncbi:MAG: DUF3575 domain-containing protein [Flavobacteriales bacterium]|nr:DUF3575 domain-containing protein [Flavobacteriales bacterium]
MFRCILILFLLSSFGAASQIRVVKLNTMSATQGALQLSFEKVKDKQYSYQVGLMFRPSLNAGNMFYGIRDYSLEEGKATWYGAHVEYRFYTQKARKLHTKPYFSFFGRWTHSDASLTYKGRGLEQSETNYPIDHELTQIAAGIQYGIQWVFNNKWSIDWTVLGFGLTQYQLKSSLALNELSSLGAFEEAFSSKPFVGSKHLYTRVDDEQAEVNTTFWGVSPRTALRIGLIF